MNLQQKDKAYVWHPFTHLRFAEEHIVIEKAEGAYYYDDKGNKIIDAISSWWVNLHGHCHPHISKKVSAQLLEFEHAIFSGFTHQPAIDLAERLLKHLPASQSKIFYSDNGSTAVEVALKMALQYWANKGESKMLFVAFENAYHGDTFGGMSVGERNVFNNAFNNLLFDVVHMPVPTKKNIGYIREKLEELVKTGDVAAFIFEPLIQGAAGMLMYEPGHLDELLSVCKAYSVITIADEVMTGFGRTGRFFASDYLQHSPDIICMSKGLTGGYLPLGATSCAEFIYNAFISEDKSRTFFHGHSYTANPTACTAALASMDVMEEPQTVENIRRIQSQHEQFVLKIKNHTAINQVRLRGTVLAIELKTGEQTHYLNKASESITEFFIKRNILLRPLGNVFYLIPPYCISEADLNYIYNAITEFLDTR